MAENENLEREGANISHVLWPLLGAFIAFLILFVSTVTNTFVIMLGPEFSMTLYGSIVIARQIWLQIAAYRHNAEIIRMQALPVESALLLMYPVRARAIRKICRRHQPFDRMRARLMKALNLSDEDWYRLRREFFGELFTNQNAPTIAVVIPIYGIPWDQIEAQVRSLASQTYPIRKGYCIVNDADDFDTIENLRRLLPEVNNTLGKEIFEVHIEPKSGKRHAMYNGFTRALRARVDLILNSDGDTYADIDAIANAVLSFHAYPDVDLITGDVRVSNYKANLLTRFTGLRYWVAFWKERAAQSWSRKYIKSRDKVIRGQMVCGSGPFLMMRAHKLDQILEKWHKQTFLGEECTYGDDRHLTTLSLLLGWGTMFINGCIVWTDAPTNIWLWIRQQFRWGQSSNRENYVIVDKGGLPNLTWLVKFDLFYLTFFPFLIAGAVISVLVKALESFVATLNPQLQSAFNESVPYLVIVVGFLVVFSELLNFAKIGMRFLGSRLAKGFAPTWDKVSGYIDIGVIIVFVTLLASNGFVYADPSFGEALGAFWDVVWPYLRVILILQFIFQSLYGWLITGDPFFLLWPGYNILYFRFLMKQKITTVIGMRITAWGTRANATGSMEEKEGEAA